MWVTLGCTTQRLYLVTQFFLEIFFLLCEDDEEALLNYGEMLERGIGVPQDDREAVRLYTRAHELGNVEGTYRLAVCVDEERGVEQGTTTAGDAVRLFELAAREGHPDARAHLEAMDAQQENVRLRGRD